MVHRQRAGGSEAAKIALILALFALVVIAVAAQDARADVTWDARINAAVYDTSRGKVGTGGAELYTIMSDLTGYDADGQKVIATVHGQPYDFGASPYCRWQRGPQFGDDGITMANEYVREYFEKQGLDEVVKQKWHGIDDTYHPAWGGGTRVDGVQVIGELTGETKPDEIVIVCGHLDSVAFDGIVPMDFIFAPGADDNLTGAATTMIAARELAPYEFARTIRFACWGGEEEGLLGAMAYAKRCQRRGEKIVAIVNVEMTGRDLDAANPESAGVMEVHARGAKKSGPFGAGRRDIPIWRTFRDVVTTYGVLVTPKLIRDDQEYSDHSAFWRYGYGAIAVEEQDLKNNANYHCATDTVANLSWLYFKRIASATVGTTAHLAQILEPPRQQKKH
jgi:hypothetical protein